MLKTAQFIAYRTPKHSAPFKRANWVYISCTKCIPPTGLAQTRKFQNVGNTMDKPPKHQIVYFKGLTSEVREFGKFRKVLHTGLYSQLVAMEVPVGGEIGDEVHTVDQILLFTSGKGKATVAGKDQEVNASDVVVVPAGTQHQFINIGDKPLELITVYSPAEHDPRTVHKTKEEGDELEDAGKDEAPEWSRRSKKENEKMGLVKLSGGPYEGE